MSKARVMSFPRDVSNANYDCITTGTPGACRLSQDTQPGPAADLN
jgi:hypothetical protein